MTEEYYGKAYVRFGEKYLSQTLIALDEEAVRNYMIYAWRYSGVNNNDKSKMTNHLASINWVPYSKESRQKIFQSAYNEFKTWVTRLDKNKNLAETAQVAGLDEAFKTAMNTEGDPAKAPNDLCRYMASAILAAQKGDTASFVQIARTLYPIVKDYPAKKTPMGKKALSFIVAPNSDMNLTDLQAEILSDQLALWSTSGNLTVAEDLWNLIIRSGKGWAPYRIPEKDMALAQKLNETAAKAFIANMDKPGAFTLFDWIRATRLGEGWHNKDLNQDVMIKMIESKLLLKDDAPRYGGAQSGTVSYMWLLRYEFNVPEKYNYTRYFDDMFVEEAVKTGFLDIGYWNIAGRDEQYKIRNLAAKMLPEYGALPLGFGNQKPAYSLYDLWRWHSAVLGIEQTQRDAFLNKIEALAGTKRFDHFAMGSQSIWCRQIDTREPEGRKEFFSRLKSYLDKTEKVHYRPHAINVRRIEYMPRPANFTTNELNTLISIFSAKHMPPIRPSGYGLEDTAIRLCQRLLKDNRDDILLSLAPQFWIIARDIRYAPFQRLLLSFGEDCLALGKPELAASFGTAGIAIAGAYMDESLRTGLDGLYSRSLGSIGGIIPVPRSDPKYPLFAAQADYFSNNIQSAWQNYMSGRRFMPTTYMELDPMFCAWIINQNTEAGNFDEAETLARNMIQWMDSDAARFSPDVRVNVLLAYANIPFNKGEYPRANALYTRIAAAREFDGTRGKIDAELRIAEVSRKSGLPNEAISHLEKLLDRKDRYTVKEANYHLALVKYDFEEYMGAAESLEKVFAIDPTHAGGRILEGKINLKLKRLEQAARIDKVGLSADKQYIVPGKTLRIGMEDRTLAIVGKTTAIQIRAWTDSGDEELFDLLPFANSKTRFEGSIRTTMGKAVKQDKTLQMLGNDKVYYDLSKQFKAAHGIADTPANILTVASDPELYVSSGRILTKEESEEMALETMIRARLIHQRRGNLLDDESDAFASQQSKDQVKPGNKINVRVIDLDQNTTGQKDKITVTASSASGDKIETFALIETGEYTGIFEGSIPTESAPAIAYATDSDEGRDPNFVISSGNHPAWIALPDNKRPKNFSVDLNSYEVIDEMTLTSAETGRRIKSFVLQISLNGKTFKTVGSWPTPYKPWNGVAHGAIIKHYSNRKRTASERTAEFRAVFENTPQTSQRMIELNNKTLAASWREDVFGHADALRIDWNDARQRWYIARFSGAFFLNKRETRTFKLIPSASGSGMEYYLTVDDQIGIFRDKSGRVMETPLEFSDALQKGLHRVDVYVYAIRRSRPGFRVMCDTEEPPYMMPCPMEMFDISKLPRAQIELREFPATITANDDATQFNVKFSPNTRARGIRFSMHDFEMDAPAINRIVLTGPADQDNKRATYLPTKANLMALKNNNVLEIVPGDTISITYEAPKSISDDSRVQEAFLSAAYANGEIRPSVIVEYETDANGMREPIYVTMRRFRPGDTIQVLIEDHDNDVSDKQDKTTFTVKTQSANAKEITLEALETKNHTGVFLGRVFPVAGEPKRPSEIKVEDGDDLVLSYMDTENTDPGIPWRRTAMLEQAWYQNPELYVYNMTSRKLPAEQIAEAEQKRIIIDEYVPVRYDMIASRHDDKKSDNEPTVMIGGTLLVELIWPTIVQSEASLASVYIQTSAGRTDAGKQDTDEFDLNVPGTIRIDSYPISISRMDPPPGYRNCVVSGARYVGDPLDDGRFMFTLPVNLGELPQESAAFEPVKKKSFGQQVTYIEEEPEQKSIMVSGNDTLYIGFQYTNQSGVAQWITKTAKLDSDAFFDVMERQYQETITGAYVGDSVYFRVVDKAVDKSSDHDAVEISVGSSSGKTKTVKLMETYPHSGEFKGLLKFVYATDEAPDAADDTAWDAGVMPVKYGETITARYNPGRPSANALEQQIEIFKGSDGSLIPFTKRFKDSDIAVLTQLTTAEAYFELAKQHRQLGQVDMARHEIAAGKHILEEALRDYPDTDARAQADYLLANLALESAEEAKEKGDAEKYYNEAISRFSTIAATAGDSAYAPKAQFKKALTLEKMGNIDQACEEYVKLSYRWPENELIAETIARLGQYFFNKGKALNDEIGALTDIIQQEKKKQAAKEMFTTAAQVFGRLAPRFPAHTLADKATMLSAQCYMRAEDFPKAIEVFTIILDNKNADNDLRAEAMYWRGDCHMKNRSKENLMEAYRMFKLLTWDYPASKWAKYARGRLAERDLAKLDVE
ncbi:MAG: outer membrane protein assembly factor BamD [Lentisphaerae bacterium]|nr:outer membrane protein assembly factor BamD [Lentisphaerota bacterium]